MEQQHVSPKLVAVLVVALISIAGYFYFKPDKITNYPSSNVNIVAFGDSLIAGVGSSGNGDLVSLLSQKTGRTIINLGNSGDTTEDAIKRLPDVVDQKPKATIILLGGNDFLRKVNREKTFDNLRLIIKTIQSTGSVTVLLGVRSGVLGGSADSDYKKLAKETGSLYVPDVLDGLFGRSDLMSDAIHPNNAGYSLIAEKVYPILKKAL
jgi:acyl-CoA thioesterase-1